MWRVIPLAVTLVAAVAQAEETGDDDSSLIDPTLTPSADQAVEDEVEASRPYQFGAGLSFRMLAVEDEDPANDRLLLYSVNASVEPFERGSVFIRTGFTQAFVVEDGGEVTVGGRTFEVEGTDEALQMQDTQIGIAYKTPIELTNDRTLGLSHTLKLFLPTSRISRARDMYLAPQGVVTASSRIVGDLNAQLSTSFRYRFHAFAERAGTEGGMNTQLDTGVRFGLAYGLIDSPTFGTLGVGATTLSSWSRTYESRDEHEAATADAGVWLQTWGWSVGLDYTPIEYVTAAVAVEHGMPVLRNGVANVDFLHRDATELVFSVSGQY